MGLLARCFAVSFVVSTSACYSPDLRDCTVSCAAETDCAAGQVCGSDRFCASPSVAGRCASLPTDDGGVPPKHDAGHVVDAETVVTPDAAPDAPPLPTTTSLHLHIEGKGRIVVDTVGTCESDAPQNGDCQFTVSLNDQLTARAQPYSDQRFDRWTTVPCAAEDSTSCSFVTVGPLNVSAKFRKDD